MRPVPEIGLYIIMSKMDNKMILCAIGGGKDSIQSDCFGVEKTEGKLCSVIDRYKKTAQGYAVHFYAIFSSYLAAVASERVAPLWPDSWGRSHVVNCQ